MTQGQSVDVAESNIKVLGYDHKKGKPVPSKIYRIILKDLARAYEVNLPTGELLFKATADHMIYSLTEGSYTKLKHLVDRELVSTIDCKGNPIEVVVSYSGEIIDVLDMQTETENYFSNGILSHNSGGNSLKFYASQRLDVRRIGSIKNSDGDVIGNKVRVKFVKNKVASPFREAETLIRFGEGIPRDHEILTMSEELGYIVKAGSWYKYNDANIGQGEVQSCQYLKDNPDLMDELEKKIREEYNI